MQRIDGLLHRFFFFFFFVCVLQKKKPRGKPCHSDKKTRVLFSYSYYLKKNCVINVWHTVSPIPPPSPPPARPAPPN